MWINIFDGANTYRFDGGKLYSQNEETKEWDVEVTVDESSYAGMILSSLQQMTGGDENPQL